MVNHLDAVGWDLKEGRVELPILNSGEMVIGVEIALHTGYGVHGFVVKSHFVKGIVLVGDCKNAKRLIDIRLEILLELVEK